MAALAVIGIAWASYFAQMHVIKADLGVSDATYGLLVLISALGAVGAMFWLRSANDLQAHSPWSLAQLA
jgi:hypothetical protein